MTRHAEVARSAEVRNRIPALARLAEGIGDRQVRNLGTIGGSIANSDPAADYPAAVLGLGATVITNARKIDADSFFTGLFGTALKTGEIITAVSFPLPEQSAYVKFKQPASHFALVGVFVARTGKEVRVAVTGVVCTCSGLPYSSRRWPGASLPSRVTVCRCQPMGSTRTSMPALTTARTSSRCSRGGPCSKRSVEAPDMSPARRRSA